MPVLSTCVSTSTCPRRSSPPPSRRPLVPLLPAVPVNILCFFRVIAQCCFIVIWTIMLFDRGKMRRRPCVFRGLHFDRVSLGGYLNIAQYQEFHQHTMPNRMLSYLDNYLGVPPKPTYFPTDKNWTGVCKSYCDLLKLTMFLFSCSFV